MEIDSTISYTHYFVQRTNVLGVGITPASITSSLFTVSRWIENHEKHYVCVTGMHGVVESQKNVDLKRIHNRSGMTVPDGMPMVILSRLAGKTNVERVYGPDLMLALCKLSNEKGYRNFLYGGEQGVPDQLADVLKARYPDLSICGTFSPPFRPLTPEEDGEITAIINATDPDIVWVGLGTPKQEWWMAEFRSLLTAPVLIGVGAAFDMLSGNLPQAPNWMQRNGLEWLFRLMHEPRRLWRRYLFGITRYILYLFLQKSGLREFPLER